MADSPSSPGSPSAQCGHGVGGPKSRRSGARREKKTMPDGSGVGRSSPVLFLVLFSLFEVVLGMIAYRCKSMIGGQILREALVKKGDEGCEGSAICQPFGCSLGHGFRSAAFFVLPHPGSTCLAAEMGPLGFRWLATSSHASITIIPKRPGWPAASVLSGAKYQFLSQGEWLMGCWGWMWPSGQVVNLG